MSLAWLSDEMGMGIERCSRKIYFGKWSRESEGYRLTSDDCSISKKLIPLPRTFVWNEEQDEPIASLLFTANDTGVENVTYRHSMQGR